MAKEFSEFLKALKTFGKSSAKSASKVAARWGIGGAKDLKTTDRHWIEWLKANDKDGRFVSMGKDTVGKHIWKDTTTGAKLNSKKAAQTLYESGVKGGFTPTFKQATKDAAKKGVAFAKSEAPAFKAGLKTAGKALERGGGWAKGVAEFACKHPILSGLIATVAYKKTGHNDGIVNGLGRLVGDDDFRRKGAIKEAQNLLFGVRTTTDGQEVDTPLTEMLLDSLFGYGTYKSLGNHISNAGEQMITKLEAMKEKGGEAGEWAKEQLANFYNNGALSSQPTYDYEGNMMVKDTGTGQYVDNTTKQYPSLGGAAGGVMNSLNNAANYVSGQNVNKMDVASLLMSAFLFSRAGLMAKVGSAVLGGVTMHNINKRGHSEQMSPSEALTANRQTQVTQPLYYPQQEEDKSSGRGMGI